ncbi:MAG: pentapeptide repeat-containing protein, partial [Bdellovibrionales bacterium]
TLNQTNFTSSQLNESTFYLSNISKSIFNKALLKKSNLHGISAFETKFISANLEMANLTKGYFVLADFSKANLKGADLSRSNLLGAKFFESDLRDANLEKVKNLSHKNLQGALYNRNTNWPGDDKDFEMNRLKVKKLCGPFSNREQICKVSPIKRPPAF